MGMAKTQCLDKTGERRWEDQLNGLIQALLEERAQLLSIGGELLRRNVWLDRDH